MYFLFFFESERGNSTPFEIRYDGKIFFLQNVIFTKWNDTSYKYLLNSIVEVKTNQKCLPHQFIFIIFNT